MLSRSPIKRKAKAPPSAIEQRHMDRVGQMPCFACGRRPIELHHIMHMPGKKTRRDHRYIVPLCGYCHRDGKHGVHGMGSERIFKDVLRVDLVKMAVREWDISNA
jgi:hypothetical protein